MQAGSSAGGRILRCRLRVAVKSALLLLLAGSVLPGFVLALDVPPLTGRIVDTAHLVTPDLAASLSQELAAHERRTGNQVAVLTLPSLQGEPLEEFSHRVATTWKLGQKGTDNGVLLLIAAQDRRIRIEVGYGLEGVLTDAVTSRIIRNEMVPRFRAGEYSQGIAAGLRAILAADVSAVQNALQHLRDPLDPGAGYVHAPPLNGAQRNFCSAPFAIDVPADALLTPRHSVTLVTHSTDNSFPVARGDLSRLTLRCKSADQCHAGISVNNPADCDGKPFTITVVISGPGADRVRRVTSINPGGQFYLVPRGGGTYTVTLFYQGQGPFTLSFYAYDANGDAACSGSIGLEALGACPASGSGAVRAEHLLPAGVVAGATGSGP